MEGKHHTIKLLAIGLASAFLFGAATPASKALLTGIHPQVLAGLLYLGAAVGVLPVVVRTKSFRPPWHGGRRTLLLLTGAVVLGGILGPLLLLLGLRAASSGSVVLWLNLEFVATVALGHFIFREHLRVRGWAAAGGTLLAAVLLAGGEGDVGVLSFCFVASACLCWGFDNHFTALIDGITPAQTTLWKGVVAGSFNLIAGGLLADTVGKPHVVLLSLLVGALCYGMSLMLYILTAQGLGASRSQMIFSASPFFGLLLAVVVLGESFTGPQALAAGIIAASLILLFSEKHAHVHRHDSIAHEHGHSHTDGHHNHEHEGLPVTMRHVHRHEHEAVEHIHHHWPDLHHRHGHGDDEKCQPPKKRDPGAGP
jgi:drug/metabolite transporter (DMT)-like permease